MDFFPTTRRADLGPAVSCPSCKISSRELYCSSCVTDALKHEAAVHDAQKSSRDNTKRLLSNFLIDNMDSATLAFETNHLEGENEKMRLLVEQTRLQLARLRDAKKEWQEKLDRRRRELMLAKERMAKSSQYDQDIVDPVCASLEQTAESLEETIASERRKKMEQLHELFTLEVAEPGFSPVSKIAGVPLGDLQKIDGSDPQQLLALTLVSRMVILAAHYLRIPLPFQLIYDKGEAWIEHRGALVPVYRKVRNLHINIRMLCIAQGVPSNVLAKVDFVESLWQLFHSPSLGRSIREAMLEAEVRENKPVLRKSAEGLISNGSSTITGEGSRSKSRRAKKREEEDDFVLVG